MGDRIKNNGKGGDPQNETGPNAQDAAMDDLEEIRTRALLLQGQAGGGRWNNVSEEEQEAIAGKALYNAVAKKAIAKQMVEPFLKGAAEAYGAEIPEYVFGIVGDALVDGGFAVLEGEGLGAILEAAGIGAAVGLPLLWPVILLGAALWEATSEINEESVKRIKEEEIAENGVIRNDDGTYASKKTPPNVRLGYTWKPSDKVGRGGFVPMGDGRSVYVGAVPGQEYKDGEFMTLWEQQRNPLKHLYNLSNTPDPEIIQTMQAISEDKQARIEKYIEEYPKKLKERAKFREDHARASQGTEPFDFGKPGQSDPLGSSPAYIPFSGDRLNGSSSSAYHPSYNFSKPPVEDRKLYQEMLQNGYMDENNPETSMFDSPYTTTSGMYNPHPKWKKREDPWTPHWEISTPAAATDKTKKTAAHPSHAKHPGKNAHTVAAPKGAGVINASPEEKAFSTFPHNGSKSATPAHHPAATDHKHHHKPAHTDPHKHPHKPAQPAATTNKIFAMLPKDKINAQQPVTYNITVNELIGQKIGTHNVKGTDGDTKNVGESMAKLLKSVVQSHTA